jgi:hypothetical protein
VNYALNRNKIKKQVAKHAPLPRNLYFEGTNVCNADCVFCPYTRMERKKITMPMELFKNIISQYVEMGGNSVGFTPIVGDPMADKFLLDRLEYLNSIPQIENVGFYTNAIALKPEKAKRLTEFKNLKISLSISFGGHDRETFEKIMGVDKYHLVEKYVTNFLNILETHGHEKLSVKLDFRCPDSSGSGSFGEKVAECVAKGLVSVSSLEGNFDTFGGLMTQSDLDRADMGLVMGYGYPKFGPCEIPFTKPFVLADGRLNACAERDLEASLVIGDLNKERLEDLLYGPKMKEFIDSFYKLDSLPKVCQECSVYQSIYNTNAKVWKSDLNWKG